jgi:citrate lyase beta subunit
VQGDSERMLERSTASGSDVLLLNLEDGVAAGRSV